MGLGFGRTLLKLASIAIAIALFVALSSAQRPKVLAPHQSIAPRVPKNKEVSLPPAKLGSVVGGPWMVNANFKSSIYIKDVVEVYPVTVIPILYLSNGNRYKLPEVNLEPAGTAIVDVNAALDSLGLASYATLSGYVELQYNFPWAPICAFIRNVDTVHSMIFLQGIQVLPAELLAGTSSQPAIKQQILEGMWWKHEANVSGFVTLSNTSARPIAASVQTSDSTGKAFATHSVNISANGTKIVQMSELASVTQTEGGIRVSYTGPQDALIVNGGLQDASVGYSANLHFLAAQANPKLSPLSAVELGLMSGVADPMMSFPAGTTFTPYSLLRNTSSLPATVTPTLWWMQAGSAQSFQMPTITLQAYQAQRLDLPSMLSAAGLKNFNGSFNINFDVQGVYGAVLQAAGSVDQTNTYVFEVNARGIGVSGSRSMPYWSTGNGDDTMITIWNPADEAQDFIVKLFFSGGQYGLPIHLPARATQALNVSEVIQSQVPDAQGSIIPAGIHDGSLEITGGLADNQTILFAADVGIYNVRKAICGAPNCTSCNGMTTAAVAANPFSVAVGGQTQLNFTITWNTGNQYNFNSSSTWSSNNAPVATVQTGLTKGVSAGSATITAKVMSAQPVYVAQICSQGSPMCPNGEPAPTAPGTVPPTISQNQNLWYFGNGIPTPSGFTLGGTTATLTASGSGSGTYTWTITAGSTKAALQGTTSGQNVTSVQIASTSYSTSANDVTVQLQFTPTGASAVTATYSLSVDSPYKLVPQTITDEGISGSSCLNPPSGTTGYLSTIGYVLKSFLGVTMNFVPVNETFSGLTDDYIGNNWPTYVPQSGTTNFSGVIADHICALQGGLTPTPLQPQNPLLSTKIDHGSQALFGGSSNEAEGVQVQSDTLQRYRDHGRHLSIVSPVR